MPTVEEHLLKVVDQVCARPGLYVGCQDFYAVTKYLDGYIRGLMEFGGLRRDPFGWFLPVLEHRHGFSNSGWGWQRHFFHDMKSDLRAIQELPGLLREVTAIPASRIEEIYGTRPPNYHPPDSPQTAHYGRSAEQGAAPNGGPATRLGNSDATEGPPSVS
jgi:hypothetical protein